MMKPLLKFAEMLNERLDLSFFDFGLIFLKIYQNMELGCQKHTFLTTSSKLPKGKNFDQNLKN